MFHDIDRLRTNVEELKSFSTRVADAVEHYADQLIARGAVPPAGMLDHLKDLESRCHGLHRVLLLKSDIETADSTVSATSTIAALEQALEVATERKQAIETLESWRGIRHADDAEFSPLNTYLDRINELQHALQQEPIGVTVAEIDEVSNPDSALRALPRLVHDCERLSDDEWTSLHDRVTEEFGPAMGTAVARGKLVSVFTNASADGVVADDASTGPTTSVPGTTKAAGSVAAAAGATIAQTLTDDAASADHDASIAPSDGDSGDSAIHDGSVAVRADTGDPRVPRMVSAAPAERSRRMARPSPPPISAKPRSASGSLAEQALSSDGAMRFEHISKLILQLLADNRFSPAWHLACCLEERKSIDTRFVPSTLVRAVGCGMNVQRAGGELSLLLEYDIGAPETVEVIDNDGGWGTAIQILQIAAAVRPSLLAPESKSSRALHNLNVNGELSALRNYCVRIALFGDQGRALNPAMFRRTRSRDAWQQELDGLASEVSAWSQQLPRETVRFESATHCFLRNHWTLRRRGHVASDEAATQWMAWIDSVELQDSLLSPIVNNDAAAIADVRELLQRIERDVHDDNSERSALTSAERRAIAFARRWIALHESAPADGSHIPRRAEDLQDEQLAADLRREVLQRHDGVVDELQRYGSLHDHFAIGSAIQCCITAMESVRSIFTSRDDVRGEEPDTRHLLNGELLKVAAVRLGEQWEPESDPMVLEDSLLELVMNENLDWRAAFDAQCDFRDHEATGRILELKVWQSEDELAQLSQHREQLIEQCRESLEQDVADSRSRIHEAFNLGLLTEADRDRFESQIATLTAASSRSLQFSVFHHRLSDLRESIDRRRQYELERAQRRLQQLQQAIPDANFNEVNSALADGDLHKASEAMHRVERRPDGRETDWVR